MMYLVTAYIGIIFTMDVDQPENMQTKNANADITGVNQSNLVATARQNDEDEEFEEFPIYQTPKENGLHSNGTAVAGTKDAVSAPPNVWEDNWDDETVETEFHKQLEEELKKRGFKLD